MIKHFCNKCGKEVDSSKEISTSKDNVAYWGIFCDACEKEWQNSRQAIIDEHKKKIDKLTDKWCKFMGKLPGA